PSSAKRRTAAGLWSWPSPSTAGSILFSRPQTFSASRPCGSTPCLALRWCSGAGCCGGGVGAGGRRPDRYGLVTPPDRHLGYTEGAGLTLMIRIDGVIWLEEITALARR